MVGSIAELLHPAFGPMPCCHPTARSRTHSLWPRHADRASSPCFPLARLFVEPEVFEARVIVDAVDHCNKPLKLWLPAIRCSRVKQDRSCVVLGQLAFDLPYQPLALLHIAHD